MFIDKIIPITHLTVSEICDLETLYEFFSCIPLLKYLKIEILSKVGCYEFNNLDYLNEPAVCLTQVIIHNKYWFECDFYELIFKQTPNLKILTFSIIYGEQELFSLVENSIEIFDVYRWENIVRQLPINCCKSTSDHCHTMTICEWFFG